MARRESHVKAFPESLKDIFFFNQRWLPLERADLDRVAPAHRPSRRCPTPLEMHFVDEGPDYLHADFGPSDGASAQRNASDMAEADDDPSANRAVGADETEPSDDDAEVVLCLHGNPTWSFYYRRLVTALRGRYRVIAPDHIGMGFSAKPRAYPYRLANHIGNLEALVDWLGLKNITLVMHDWGGAIGFGYATKHPENVKRLIVLNTAAFRSRRIPWRIAACRIPLVGALMVRGFNAFARAALTQATTSPGNLAGPIGEGLIWPYRDWRSRIGILRFVQDIPLRPSHPSYSTLLAIENNLHLLSQKPMLIGWGMRDWCFSPEPFLDEFIRRFPAAQVHRYADAGHYVLEDAHDRLVPTIESFLAGTASTPSPPTSPTHHPQ